MNEIKWTCSGVTVPAGGGIQCCEPNLSDQRRNEITVTGRSNSVNHLTTLLEILNPIQTQCLISIGRIQWYNTTQHQHLAIEPLLRKNLCLLSSESLKE